MKNAINILSIILLFSCSSLFGQLEKGTITIRKTDENIIGKTLSLFDMRTRECGTIHFKSDSTCELTFLFEKEELKNVRVFLNSNSSFKKVKCNYSILSDTSFAINTTDFEDTCSYQFIDDTNNIVKMLHTPQGTFDNNQYAFFYGLDSIVFSQSFLRSISDFDFTDSISRIDSLYKNVKDPEERDALNKKLKESISAYKASINFYYFIGKYDRNGNKIKLINSEDEIFSTLFIQKNSEFYSLKSINRMDVTLPLVSEYTHKTFGDLTFEYDKCIVKFQKPISDFSKKIDRGEIFFTDTLLAYYPTGQKIYLKSDEDSFAIVNPDYLEYAKIKGTIGGYYESYLESLNGLKIKMNPLFFSINSAYQVPDRKMNDTLGTWDYQINKGILCVYNEQDTFIDQMKNGTGNIRFTYLNNEPYVFGAYHRKNNRTNKNEFILLFSNKTGVKYTTQLFDYKTAKEQVLKSSFKAKSGVEYDYFRYSSSSDYLWIEYQSGKLEQCEFFNFHKAVRSGSGRKKKNYYLLN